MSIGIVWFIYIMILGGLGTGWFFLCRSVDWDEECLFPFTFILFVLAAGAAVFTFGILT